nr:immunoglobulin light chain junction region [Macaca mulatta]MOV76822.1 immunoglobulin light chain junction region [Macaca mulatta]MOW14639.1 immunoglobulin light chain junction region [Macaca mulatta]
CQQYSALLSF